MHRPVTLERAIGIIGCLVESGFTTHEDEFTDHAECSLCLDVRSAKEFLADVEELAGLNQAKYETSDCGGVITTSAFWDCECPDDVLFIHPRDVDRCERCGASSDSADSPDAHVSEVITFGLAKAADFQGL